MQLQAYFAGELKHFDLPWRRVEVRSNKPSTMRCTPFRLVTRTAGDWPNRSMDSPRRWSGMRF